MNLASLFDLAGPDLIIILLIVVLLFGAKKLPELSNVADQSEEGRNRKRDYAKINTLLTIIVLLAAFFLLSVLLSR